WIPVLEDVQVGLNPAFDAVVAPLFRGQIRHGWPWVPPIFEPRAIDATRHFLAQSLSGLFGFKQFQQCDVLSKVALNLQADAWDGTVDPKSLARIGQAGFFTFRIEPGVCAWTNGQPMDVTMQIPHPGSQWILENCRWRGTNGRSSGIDPNNISTLLHWL